MSEVTAQQSCFDLAMELTRGPEFFTETGQPTDAVLRYTGERLEQDGQRCLVVGALRLLGCSDREIARVVKCDVRSIPLMLEEAEKSRRIPALKDRLSKLTGTNAERCQIALAELLDRASGGSVSVELAAMIKAVSTAGGINTQNLQLLTGGATEILEVRAGAGRAEIEGWMRDVVAEAPAIDAPVDLQSPGNAAKPLQIAANDGYEAASDTSAAAGGASLDGIAPGAGGVTTDGVGAGDDGLTGSKILMEVPRG